MRLALSLVGIALLGGACDSEPPEDAPINITLSSDPTSSECPSALCSDYDMSCGAILMLRYTDPATGEVLRFPNGTKRQFCLAAEGSDSLCDLGALLAQQPSLGVPQENVRVEVALWEPGQLGDPSQPDQIECPDVNSAELFDAFGRPNSQRSP